MPNLRGSQLALSSRVRRGARQGMASDTALRKIGLT